MSFQKPRTGQEFTQTIGLFTLEFVLPSKSPSYRMFLFSSPKAWARTTGMHRKREGTQTTTDMMTDEVQPPGNYFTLADVLSGLPRVLYNL